MDSPFSGAIGFLFVGSFVTAYLIPDSVVIISLAVAAYDGCGCATSAAMDVPPTMVATEVERKPLRLPRVDSDTAAFSLPDNEKAAAPELPRRKMTVDTIDFTMMLL